MAGTANAHLGIKTVGWLTAINREYLEKVGGESTVRSELPMDWFRLLDYDDGIVIQAGPQPEAAPTNAPLPARMVRPDICSCSPSGRRKSDCTMRPPRANYA